MAENANLGQRMPTKDGNGHLRAENGT